MNLVVNLRQSYKITNYRNNHRVIGLNINHKRARIRYYSGILKDELTLREVEPDFIVTGDDWEGFGCWGFYRLRNQIRVFNAQGILDWEITRNKFKQN